MAKRIDEALLRLPERIQRQLQDDSARGRRSPYSEVAWPLSDVLLHRADRIAGLERALAEQKEATSKVLKKAKSALNTAVSCMFSPALKPASDMAPFWAEVEGAQAAIDAALGIAPVAQASGAPGTNHPKPAPASPPNSISSKESGNG